MTRVLVLSLSAEDSFQAVPLGAASVVSAMRSDPHLSSRIACDLLDFTAGSTAAVIAETVFSALAAEATPLAAGNAPLANIAPLAAASPAAPAADRPLIAFSLYVWNRPVLEAAAILIRARYPQAVLVAGGPEVTGSPASFTLFDYLVCGEGERALRELTAALLNGTAVPGYISARARAPATDLAALESPWLSGTLEDCAAVSVHRGALWELSRGCPYRCAYCYESKGDHHVRAMPLERLEAELDWFISKGIERVFVLDPTYNANRDRALKLLRLLAAKGQSLHYNFEVRAELLDKEMVKAFSEIPCSLQIGLQSTNPAALALVNRSFDQKSFTRKIALLNEAGLVFGLDLMYGLPGDSISTFRNSLDYALSLFPNNLELFRLAVLPGTELADKASSLSLKHQDAPPYHVLSTPTFAARDIERAGELARACDIFYTRGRAVSWFMSVLHPIGLKGSQFLADFAAFTSVSGENLTHRQAEELQLAFIEAKYAEKGKNYLVPAIADIIKLNGAWTRALAEGEETVLDLIYHPEDLMSPEVMDVVSFTDNAYMEDCTVRVFPGADGPDLEFL